MSTIRLPFEDVFADESGGNIKTPQSEYLKEGRFPVIDQGKSLIAGYVNDPTRICGGGRPAIVFGDHTRCVKFADKPFCMGADGVKVLRPKIEADLKYLYYYLRHLQLPDAGYDRHFKYLKRTEIVLLSIPEQRRVAAILDKADALRTKSREALNQFDYLAQSIFVEMFGHPAENPMNWEIRALKGLGRISTGGTPPSAQEGMFGGDVPFITPGDLESDLPVRRTLTEAGARIVGTVRPGTALVCCIGATIGKMSSASARSAFNQQLNSVEWFEDVIDDAFGLAALRFFKPTIVAWGSATTLPILKKSSFEKIEIPVPPIDMQREFGQRMRYFAALKGKHKEELELLTMLFDSLQSRAFRGAL